MIPDFLLETVKARRSWADAIDPKRTQMPAQDTIPGQTLNYHRWRNQSIPRQKQIHTISFHDPALQRIITKKNQYKDGNHALEQPRK